MVDVAGGVCSTLIPASSSTALAEDGVVARGGGCKTSLGAPGWSSSELSLTASSSDDSNIVSASEDTKMSELAGENVPVFIGTQTTCLKSWECLSASMKQNSSRPGGWYARPSWASAGLTSPEGHKYLCWDGRSGSGLGSWTGRLAFDPAEGPAWNTPTPGRMLMFSVSEAMRANCSLTGVPSWL